MAVSLLAWSCFSIGIAAAQEPSPPQEDVARDGAEDPAAESDDATDTESVIPPPPPDPVPSYEPSKDLEGWHWMGTTSGLMVGGATTAIALPLLLHRTEPMRELTSDEVAENVLLSVSSLLLTAGLTVGGYFLFPALAEEGDWDDGLGYDIALAEIFGLVCAALGASIAAVAEASDVALAIATASSGVGGIVLGAITGVALDEPETYEDVRLFPLLGTASFTLLALLTSVLVAGIGGFDEPWEEVMLVTSSVGVAGAIGTTALAAVQ